MKKYKRIITTGELRNRRNERRETVVAVLVLLVIFVVVPILAMLFFSPYTDAIYHTAFSGINYKMLIAIVMLMLSILFTGICFLIIWSDKKRTTLKGYLKIIPYTFVAGMVLHAAAINLLLSINLWMADSLTYEKEYKVLEVRTQKSIRN